MPADTPTPLATAAQFAEGAFADLSRSFSPTALNNIMIDATRACETECDRRLAPFTGLVEHHRAEGIDPDEYGDSATIPLDLPGTLGMSYGTALGASGSLVRHTWVEQYAARYPEYWSYSNVSFALQRSYGGTEVFGSDRVTGPEVDTGHVWFRLGTWLPVGSRIQVTYDGGYQTIPSDLVRACKYMAAAIIARELDPMTQSHGHDPSSLEASAVAWLSPYARE